MSPGVGGVVKLAGNETTGDLTFQFLCLFHSALHALCAGRQHQFCAVGFQQLLPFNAHRVGHYDDHLITHWNGHRRQTDAGIAGGGFDNCATGLQHAPSFRIPDHLQGHPVFHRAAGIKALQFCQDPGKGVRYMQFQQGGVAHQLGNRCVDLTHLITSYQYGKII